MSLGTSITVTVYKNYKREDLGHVTSIQSKIDQSCARSISTYMYPYHMIIHLMDWIDIILPMYPCTDWPRHTVNPSTDFNYTSTCVHFLIKKKTTNSKYGWSWLKIVISSLRSLYKWCFSSGTLCSCTCSCMLWPHYRAQGHVPALWSTP